MPDIPVQTGLPDGDRSSHIRDAVADLRSTARWTIVAAGAVGALLLGGAPLTAIGEIDNIRDAILAYAGLIIALAGVSWAIWQTSEALLPRIATFAQLADPDMASLRAALALEPTAFYGPFGTSPGQLQDAAVMYETAAANLAAARAREPDEARVRVLDQAIDDARANAELARRLENNVLELIHAWKVRSAVRRARLHTFAATIVVAFGAVLYLTATS